MYDYNALKSSIDNSKYEIIIEMFMGTLMSCLTGFKLEIVTCMMIYCSEPLPLGER